MFPERVSHFHKSNIDMTKRIRFFLSSDLSARMDPSLGTLSTGFSHVTSMVILDYGVI